MWVVVMIEKSVKKTGGRGELSNFNTKTHDKQRHEKKREAAQELLEAQDKYT